MTMVKRLSIFSLIACGMLALAFPQQCYAEETLVEETAAVETATVSEEISSGSNTEIVSNSLADTPSNTSAEVTEAVFTAEQGNDLESQPAEDPQPTQEPHSDQNTQQPQELLPEQVPQQTPDQKPEQVPQQTEELQPKQVSHETEELQPEQGIQTSQDQQPEIVALSEEGSSDEQSTPVQEACAAVPVTEEPADDPQVILEPDTVEDIPEQAIDQVVPVQEAGQTISGLNTNPATPVQPTVQNTPEEETEDDAEVLPEPEMCPVEEPVWNDQLSEQPEVQHTESAGHSTAIIATEEVLAVTPMTIMPKMAAVQAKTSIAADSSYTVASGNGEYSHVITVTASATNDAVKDTDSIQQALKYAKELLTGAGGKKALVKIQTGTYLINSLKIFSNTDLQLTGSTTLRRNLTRNSGVMLIGGESNPSSISVSGGIWDGSVTKDSAGISSQALISFSNGSRITIKDMTLKNTSAPRAIALSNCSSSMVENVKIENRSDAPGGGILASGNGIQIVNNSIDNTRNEAICLTATTNAVVSNNQINNSGAEVQTYAIGVNNSQGATVKGNTIDNSYAGIVLKNTTGSTVSENTTRWQKSGYSIVLRKGSTGNTVTGNTMSKTNKVIQDSTSKNNTISNNTRFIGAFEKTGTVQRFKLDDGSYVKNRWLNVNGKFYHFDKKGRMQTGWYKENGNVYYLDPQRGYRVKYVQTIGNKEYYFARNGIMHTGWLKFKATKGWKYYGQDGAKLTGWMSTGGKFYYLDPKNEGYRVRYVQKIGNDEYYFDKNGAMHTGWLKFKKNQKWRYYNTNGAMLTGWQTISKNSYIFDSEGYRRTGWYTVNGADIFLYPDRAGNTYYLDSRTGVMRKGTQVINKSTYYFDTVTGIMEGMPSGLQLPSAIPANVINIRQFGAVSDDDRDDTDAIQNAINATSKVNNTVYIPAGKYTISIRDGRDSEGNGFKAGLVLKSGMNLIMDPGAVIEVKGNDLSGDFAAVQIRDVKNVNIFGGSITGERISHSGTKGESGHGLNVVDSKNIRIAYTKITDNWGDGIYLSTHSLDDQKYGCNRITIKGCTLKDNRRNNISIIDADNVTIDGCLITDAGSTVNGLKGTAPHAGIDIEPYYVGGDDLTKIRIPKDEVCKHIKILSTNIHVFPHTQQEANSGLFFAFQTIYNPYSASYISCDDLLIQNCRFYGDTGNYSGTHAKIANTSIKGTLYDRRRTVLSKVKYKQIWAVPF